MKLNTFSFFEDGCEIIYCPALDLYGYGVTKQDARNSFDYVLENFINYTTKHGTLNKILFSLGWIINEYENRPPTLNEMMEINEDLRNLIQNNTYTELEMDLKILL